MRRQRTTKELVLCYSLIDGSHIWVFRGFSGFSRETQPEFLAVTEH